MKSRSELFYLDEFPQSLETDILLDDIGIIQTRGFPRRDEGGYIYIYLVESARGIKPELSNRNSPRESPFHSIASKLMPRLLPLLFSLPLYPVFTNRTSYKVSLIRSYPEPSSIVEILSSGSIVRLIRRSIFEPKYSPRGRFVDSIVPWVCVKGGTVLP